ncbi:hypothetical protein BU045_12775 [Staphylococcus simulans]|nr:hypothetical protein BU045_12775 [Staphylococcus simulans]PTJ95457.1 hypothetical protein BU013_11495 [Staphylococcus simulans]RIN77131.1 hypothetical protein BU016_12930 [Staphylococcus simulans]
MTKKRRTTLDLALLIFFVSIFFIGFSGFSFRYRAVMNKKAWNGAAIPFALMGIILFMVLLQS